MAKQQTQQTTGAFIVNEGLNARETARVRVYDQVVSDGAPLIWNSDDGEYRTWGDSPYASVTIVALLVGGYMQTEEVGDEGVLIMNAVVLVGPALVDRLTVEHAQWGSDYDGDDDFDAYRDQLWGQLLVQSQIVGAPAWGPRQHLLGLGETSQAEAEPASFAMTSGNIDAAYEGHTILATENPEDPGICMLFMPPATVNQRFKIVNDADLLTLVVYPSTDESIWGGVPSSSDSSAGTANFGRMHQGAAASGNRGAYIVLVGVEGGWHVQEIATAGTDGIEWVVAS